MNSIRNNKVAKIIVTIGLLVGLVFSSIMIYNSIKELSWKKTIAKYDNYSYNYEREQQSCYDPDRPCDNYKMTEYVYNYKYEVNGVYYTYRKYTTMETPSDELEIMYNPNNPEESAEYSIFAPIIILVISSIVVLLDIIFFILLYIKKPKEKSLEKSI